MTRTTDDYQFLLLALSDAADHFDEIARKAEHWRAVLQKNELAEERWIGIKNHARYRAKVIRDVLERPGALACVAGVGT